MPAILTALVIVIVVAVVLGGYAVFTNPTRQQAKLDLQHARDSSRLDANHHQMYLFLTELEIKDSYTEALFSAVDRDRAKQLLSTYRKELTS